MLLASKEFQHVLLWQILLMFLSEHLASATCWMCCAIPKFAASAPSSPMKTEECGRAFRSRRAADDAAAARATQKEKDSAGLGPATLRGLPAQTAATAVSPRLESLSSHSGQTSLAVLGVESRVGGGEDSAATGHLSVFLFHP